MFVIYIKNGYVNYEKGEKANAKRRKEKKLKGDEKGYEKTTLAPIRNNDHGRVICSEWTVAKLDLQSFSWFETIGCSPLMGNQISSGQFNTALFEYTGIHPNPSVLEWIWVDLWACLVELHLILILYGNWFSKRSDSVTKSGSLWFFSINSQNHDGESLYIIRRNYFLHLPDS